MSGVGAFGIPDPRCIPQTSVRSILARLRRIGPLHRARPPPPGARDARLLGQQLPSYRNGTGLAEAPLAQANQAPPETTTERSQA
jgi:hypothetical protein